MHGKTVMALAGNPNSGKTTLFNLLTGKGEATGNRAGVTFEPKSAVLRRRGYVGEIIDLPGTYSLSPLGGEEQTAEKFLKTGKYDVIIDVADATNLTRALFLATELACDFPRVVLALNMADEARREGIVIDASKLSEIIGIPVIFISAVKNEGISELLNVAMSCPQSKLCGKSFGSGEERFRFCKSASLLCSTEKPRNISFSDKADKLICRRAVGIPLFFFIVFIMFALTFSGPVRLLSDGLSEIIGQTASLVGSWMISSGFGKAASGIVCDGIISGVGAVISFLPQTAVIFLILELLEDTGYMARAAYVTDGLLRSAGLSGKAFIPFLLGFGCTVPAVMSTSTLDAKERRAVIFSLPFIPCSARFPVFAMITGAFFPKHQALASFLIYLTGIVTAYVSALLFSKTSGESAPPLAVELPKYRLPQLKNLWRALNSKVGAFILRAGGIVLLCSAAVYFLCSFDLRFRFTENPSQSLMAAAGNVISPLLTPIGLNDWRICSSLISGFFAKETIVSSMLILCGGNVSGIMSIPSAASMCVFSLLYTPCAATFAAVKKELGTKSAQIAVIRCLCFAYVMSFLTYTFFSAIT